MTNGDKKYYGWELVVDLKGASPEMFTRSKLTEFVTKLCEVIEMEQCEIHFWDDLGVPDEDKQTDPRTKGTSLVCFIITSTIVIHTLDLTGEVYINIFSCREFNLSAASNYCSLFFNAIVERQYYLNRGDKCKR